MRSSNPAPDMAQCPRETDPKIDALAAALRATLGAVIDAMGARVESAVRDALASIPTVPAATTFAERLLTAEEVAERVGIDLRTWRRLEKTGQAPRGLRLGRKVVRWHPAVIDAWAKTGVVPPAPVEIEPVVAPSTRRRRPSVFAQARAEEKAS